MAFVQLNNTVRQRQADTKPADSTGIGTPDERQEYLLFLTRFQADAPVFDHYGDPFRRFQVGGQVYCLPARVLGGVIEQVGEGDFEERRVSVYQQRIAIPR